MWRILDCFQKKVRDFRCSVHTKTTLTFQKNTWRVGGTGQAMVDGKEKNWNCETPHDLETSCTLEPILSATCEKNLFCFILSSVSRKLHFSHTTGSHAIPTMQVTQWQIAVQIYSLSELWNTTWPEDSLHTRTHTSSCAGEKRFWLHSFLSPNVGCTSIPRGLYPTKHPFSLVKTAS